MTEPSEHYFDQALERAISTPLRARVLAFFNTNIDVVAHVRPEDIARIFASNPELDPKALAERAVDPVIESPEAWLVVMRDCFAHGKSFHATTASDAFLDWLAQQFKDAARSMGGQAGIIANQMASLGAQSACYSTMLAPPQAEMFVSGVEAPIVGDRGLTLGSPSLAAEPDEAIKINWIFEYGKGEPFSFGDEVIVSPRANRMILATHPAKVMAFAPELRPHLDELGAMADVGFVAGYHYAMDPMPDGRSFEVYMDETISDLTALKGRHPALRLHFEYVPLKARALEGDVLRRIGRVVDSFGINEVEIKRALGNLGLEAERDAIEADESAKTLYRGALALLETLDFSRIQVHNLGYYVILLRDGYPVDPEVAQQAALYASGVNAMKAKYGGYATPAQLPEVTQLGFYPGGLQQVAAFTDAAKELGLEPIAPGIFKHPGYHVLVVPAHVWPDPVSTVGMGDTISSSTFAKEFVG